MEVTVSEFRRDFFSLIEVALKGEEVTFIHRGIQFKLAPQIETSRLSPMQIVNPKTPDPDRNDLMDEMEKSWEKDWSSL